MIRFKLIRAAVFAATTMFAAPVALMQGCDTDDGPMEELGEDLDQAGDDARKPFDDLADELDD